MKELPNDGFETSRGALWVGIGTFFGSKLEYHKPPWFRTEVLKVKELPDDGFETSRGCPVARYWDVFWCEGKVS